MLRLKSPGFERLMQSGARGLYVPELIIFHYIPEHRLRKHYYRQWCFQRQMAAAQLDALRGQHAAFFLSFALHWETDANFGGPGRQAALTALGLTEGVSSPSLPVPAAAEFASEITAADVRKHVEYLASDALEGRGTGVPAELTCSVPVICGWIEQTKS